MTESADRNRDRRRLRTIGPYKPSLSTGYWTVGSNWPQALVVGSDSPGTIIVLNGAPRSGKSSIASVILETFDGAWMNLGVDVFRRATPAKFQPGIGLRPGGERPDLEEVIPLMYRSMYESIAAHSGEGLNVVVDVGHHDSYSKPLGILGDVAKRLSGLPAFLVGVRCPVEVIMQRRDASDSTDRPGYETSGALGEIPDAVTRWQQAVHIPGIYDLEIDTSKTTPEEAAGIIRKRVDESRPEAFTKLSGSR